MIKFLNEVMRGCMKLSRGRMAKKVIIGYVKMNKIYSNNSVTTKPYDYRRLFKLRGERMKMFAIGKQLNLEINRLLNRLVGDRAIEVIVTELNNIEYQLSPRAPDQEKREELHELCEDIRRFITRFSCLGVTFREILSECYEIDSTQVFNDGMEMLKDVYAKLQSERMGNEFDILIREIKKQKNFKLDVTNLF